MALGKLLDDRVDCSDIRNGGMPPGFQYFAEALKRLPAPYALLEGGITAIEAYALAAVYLQWTDRNHDAYLYVCLCPGKHFRSLTTDGIALGRRCPSADSGAWLWTTSF